jgi:hypothetical protein
MILLRLSGGASPEIALRPRDWTVAQPSGCVTDFGRRTPAESVNFARRFPLGGDAGFRITGPRGSLTPLERSPAEPVTSVGGFPVGKPVDADAFRPDGRQWVKEPLFPNPSGHQRRKTSTRLPRLWMFE